MSVLQRPSPAGPATRARARVVAGLLLLAAGAATVLAIMTAEVLYPAAYDPQRNTISDLAAMRPDDVVRQPSAAVFNVTMVVAGLLIAAAALLLARAAARRSAVVPVGLLGLGCVGVGLFPGNTVMAVHEVVSLVAFLSGALAVLLTAPLSPRALRPVHAVLGAVSLAMLVGYYLFPDRALFDALGEGGVERWIAFPVLLWLLVLGSALAAGRERGAA
ncbi:DUF998 domain-containing protein [Trujillonella humicola]|uniref:DUF998 domain-containing protein n=1 Tax=Trujillonella humicola TaxID=3383699 RepID=UPI003906AE14